MSNQSFHFKNDLTGVHLEFSVDAQENVYDVNFLSQNELAPLLMESLNGKNIHEAIGKLSHLNNSFEWDLLLLDLKKAFDEYLLRFAGNEKKECFCPCTGMTEEQVDSKIKAFGANRKLFVQQTTCGILCELCVKDLEFKFLEYEVIKVQKLIDEFSLVTPYSSTDFNIDKNQTNGVWCINISSSIKLTKDDQNKIETYFLTDKSLVLEVSFNH